MTNQTRTDSGTTQHVRPHFWQRLAPFLDVIGAVLIFGSWIFSHTLSQRALDQANTHQSIISRVQQFRLYGDFAHRISEIQSDLARTRNLVEDAIQSGNSLPMNAESFSEAPTWTGLTAAQIRELNDFVDDLAKYAELLGTSETKAESIEAAKDAVEKVSKEFNLARSEYDRLVVNRSMATSAADDAAADQDEEELRKRVDQLWQDYDTQKQGMLNVGDELLRTAAGESKSASQLARQCEHLSWALYILGTLIILFGRAKSVLSAKKTQSD